MDTPQTNFHSEIARILNEYRAKLNDTGLQSDTMQSPFAENESSSTIEKHYRKLAEIIIDGEQDPPYSLEEPRSHVYKSDSEIVNELELKVQRARNIISEFEADLNTKCKDLDKVIADAWKRLEVNGLTLQEFIAEDKGLEELN